MAVVAIDADLNVGVGFADVYVVDMAPEELQTADRCFA